VRRLAAGRRCVVITNKGLTPLFDGAGENIEVAHFNAIEGIDRWRDVDVLITIGRPLPCNSLSKGAGKKIARTGNSFGITGNYGAALASGKLRLSRFANEDLSFRGALAGVRSSCGSGHRKRALSGLLRGPCVDGSGLARRIFTLQHWSEQPCVRPIRAVLMTAGHNALRGSGPDQKHAFEDTLSSARPIRW